MVLTLMHKVAVNVEVAVPGGRQGVGRDDQVGSVGEAERDGAGPWVAAARVLNPKTAALVQVGALVALGSPAVCLEWSTSRALAAGATEDEITDVLLAVAPVAGLGRVVGAVTDVAAALGYDVEAALDDPIRD